jgi:hypothetical protein
VVRRRSAPKAAESADSARTLSDPQCYSPIFQLAMSQDLLTITPSSLGCAFPFQTTGLSPCHCYVAVEINDAFRYRQAFASVPEAAD